MHHLQHMLLSALLVLVVYLLYQQQQMALDTQAIYQQQTKAAEVLSTALTPLTEKVNIIQTVTDQLGKTADDATKQKLGTLQNRIKLYQALALVNQANRLRADNKGEEAAKVLLSTKSPIWQASTELATYTSRLQALMTPIDQLSAAWKNKDTQSAPDSVRQELETILGELNHD